MSAPIAVVIADDQAAQRAGFRMILESQPDIAVVGEASDGAEALELVREHPVDVVLMDVRMPEIGGIEATELILTDEAVLARGSAPRIVLVTALALDAHAPAAVVAGVHAIRYKDASPELLLDTIRAAAIDKRVRADDH